MGEQTAIVTGASRGLGRAICERLFADGYAVYALAGSAQVHELKEWSNQSPRMVTMQCDVRDEQQVAAVVAQIAERAGRLDVLINNAGVGYFESLENYTSEQFRQMFDVNVYGLFLMSKYVLPHMKAARGGIVLNIASDVSRRTFPGGSLYVASKYAVQGLSGCLAQEVREFGIRVGTLNPGMIDTYFAGSEQGAPGKEQFLQVAELADLIAYLLRAPKSINFDEIVLHPLAQDYSLS
jgi:NAD(P)-dependent dehydrogenase (short-subunit alcohol dehydrogenase family)